MIKKSFNEFIAQLSNEDKSNFLKYKEIRGIQTYKIIYDSLSKLDYNITYKDVNTIVIYDKALKKILYKYLGTLEDYIKNYIFTNFDFLDNSKLNKMKYVYFNDLPKCQSKRNYNSEITELYKRYNLTFGEMIKFLKEYKVTSFDLDKLAEIKELRNMVMHHTPLTFNVNSESIICDTQKKINQLLIMLPNNYKCGLIKDIDYITNKTKNNVNQVYFTYLLEELKNV